MRAVRDAVAAENGGNEAFWDRVPSADMSYFLGLGPVPNVASLSNPSCTMPTPGA
jgi:hypothetical protein